MNQVKSKVKVTGRMLCYLKEYQHHKRWEVIGNVRDANLTELHNLGT